MCTLTRTLPLEQPVMITSVTQMAYTIALMVPYVAAMLFFSSTLVPIARLYSTVTKQARARVVAVRTKQQVGVVQTDKEEKEQAVRAEERVPGQAADHHLCGGLLLERRGEVAVVEDGHVERARKLFKLPAQPQKLLFEFFQYQQTVSILYCKIRPGDARTV